MKRRSAIMTPQDRQERVLEVDAARYAKDLVENPILDRWKEAEKDGILMLLRDAAPGNDGNGERLMAQARLVALDNLGKSLGEMIATGQMAEEQILADRKARELKEVENG